MKNNFYNFYAKNEESLLNDIIKSIAIPSIAGDPDDYGNTFGKCVTECLNYILKRGTDEGMMSVNIGNHTGEITIGKGDHMIGILCHADVVDAGDGWNTDPYTAVIQDGNLYGRGSIDDKGPLICCLYSMKYINDNNLLPDNCRIKMIIGTDEEQNWISMDHYLSSNPEIPEVSIVPDANFPVISCEKGLINFSMYIPTTPCNNADIQIIELSGGERPNVVPSTAKCKLYSDNAALFSHLLPKISRIATDNNISVEAKIEEDTYLEIFVRGKAAHAMTPEKGVNAISGLMKILAEISLNESVIFTQEKLISFYDKYFSMEYHGESLGINCSDDESGPLTLNIGTISMDESEIKIEVNIRYPVNKTFSEINDTIKESCNTFGITLEYGVCMDPIHFNNDSQLVHTLRESYSECTGDTKSEPIALGGATYARALPNAIAFGPVFPGQEELAHEANEHFAISDFQKITEIYSDALLKLCELAVNDML